ncbi:MAG: hypothetical protein V1645_01575 [archaeon]
MRSFSQMLEACASDSNEALVKNLKTGGDVETLFSKLEKLADKEGMIQYAGVRTTIKRMREYVGTLHRDPVVRANGLYVAK